MRRVEATASSADEPGQVSDGARGFLGRQADEVGREGLAAVLRKIRTGLAMVLAVPLVLVVRLIRPLILVRFGPLRSERFGHFAANTELYLCRRDAGIDDRRSVDIFYCKFHVCNQQLRMMWARTIRVWQFARPADRLNRRLPGGSAHVIPWPYHGDRDIEGLLPVTPVHLSFTSKEEERGREEMQALGIGNDLPFVCFHARDSAYLEATFPDRNWKYHDHRDSDIRSYLPAAAELVRRGYCAVRMGAVVRDALPLSRPGIIDYAARGRSEFLDVFLGAKCEFFISDSCGVYAVAMIFRRPIIFVNFIPLEHTPMWAPHDMSIPKKLWLRSERRFLRFREIMESGMGRMLKTEEYEQRDIEVIDNTPEEITAVTVEMHERLRGTWKASEEDEELQERLRSLFRGSKLHGKPVSRIGAAFLRENRELLD